MNLNLLKNKYIISSCLLLAGILAGGYALGGIFTQGLDDSAIPGSAQTTIDYLLIALNRLACYFIRFGIVAVGVMIIIYGLMFLTSRGNPQSMSGAKAALGWGIIGGLVVFGVFTIILTVSDLAGYGATNYTGYKDILKIVNCQL